MGKASRRSRREVPWKKADELTPTQEFISRHYLDTYEEKHPDLGSTGEADLINSYPPESCPYCGSFDIRKWGFDQNKVQRYYCPVCKKTFTPITGTIFQDHKISISEWIEYSLNIERYLSINADSWNNRNAFTTSRYWLEKLFIVLETYQNHILLDEKVWMDEAYIPLRQEDLQYNDVGQRLHGISRNQMCIGVICTKETSYAVYLGQGKPSKLGVYNAFKDHIVEGSTLIHDKEKAHDLLVQELNLNSIAYDSRTLKGMPDKMNPLNRVNRVHALLKNFLYAHSGFNRDKLQGFLDLFCFVSNPPSNHLLKVEILMKYAFKTQKTLKYRDFYNVSP